MNDQSDALTLIRMPDGGYVVRKAGREPGMHMMNLFASTHIDTSLKYMRDKLLVKPSKEKSCGKH